MEVNVKMGKTSDLSDFEREMIVGARRAGASISETTTLLGFSRPTVSRVFREWQLIKKSSSCENYSGRKRLVNKRGERRVALIVRSNTRNHR